MNDVKIIAAYLPQYHEIPENNKWWGKGYTDWVAVKKSKPLYEGHKQPRIPLDENYYDLSDTDAIRWQAKLAKKYGVYGFGIYHYWFSDEQQLLTKPAELILENRDIDINFCFIWDNNSWVNKTWKNVKFTNQWAPQFEKNNKSDSGILAELKYGDEKSWDIHYAYLKKFFDDPRYIKDDGRPIFGIFQPTNDRETLLKMCSYMHELAQKDGYPGILFISAATFSRKKIDLEFRYEPFNVCSPLDYIRRKTMLKKDLKEYDYDQVWKKILFNAKYLKSGSTIYGGFVRYDDSPRRGDKANIITGESPQKFCNYLKQLLKLSKKQGKKYIYLTAWNEWGEGAYLEPDEDSGYEYLEALEKALNEYEN